MAFLIDTSLWIAIERGDLTAADINAITRQEPVFVSPVNIAEFSLGIELVDDPRRKLQALALLRKIVRKPQLRITSETGRVFGSVVAQLLKRGLEADYRIQDLWLAAQAIQRDFTIVTANLKDFKDIPGLKVIEKAIPVRGR